jgi:hypothetical protein
MRFLHLMPLKHGAPARVGRLCYPLEIFNIYLMQDLRFANGCSSSLDDQRADVAQSSSQVRAGMSCDSECFEASITIPGDSSNGVIERLEGYLHEAYAVVDTLIVESHDPAQRQHLARLARSLYKAIDASSVLR